jgi:hypothetical protein
MPVIQAFTRAQLRRAIGYNLGVVREGTTTGNGSATTLVDESLPGDADDHIGRWAIFTSGANDGRTRRVADDNGTGTLTVTATATALSSTSSGDTYELWNQDYSPTHIHNLINMALVSATGKVFDPREDVSLFADGKTARFSIPDDIYIINKIQYRHVFPFHQIHEANAIFDETSTPTGISQSIDTEVYRHGGSSLKLKFVEAAGAGAALVDSISSVDLSSKTHIEMWIRSSTALSAADFVLHLDSGTVQADGTDEESLNVPAVPVVDKWTHVRMALEEPESDTAIVSVGLEYNVDVATSLTVWIDDIKAVNHDEALWSDLHRHHWRIDNESRDLVLNSTGRSIAGYNMLKLVGGNRIATISTAETAAAEATAVEVPESYVVTRVTGQALSAVSEIGGQRAESRRSLAGYWLRESNREMKNFPFITNGRLVHTS